MVEKGSRLERRGLKVHFLHFSTFFLVLFPRGVVVCIYLLSIFLFKFINKVEKRRKESTPRTTPTFVFLHFGGESREKNTLKRRILFLRQPLTTELELCVTFLGTSGSSACIFLIKSGTVFDVIFVNFCADHLFKKRGRRTIRIEQISVKLEPRLMTAEHWGNILTPD